MVLWEFSHIDTVAQWSEKHYPGRFEYSHLDIFSNVFILLTIESSQNSWCKRKGENKSKCKEFKNTLNPLCRHERKAECY